MEQNGGETPGSVEGDMGYSLLILRDFNDSCHLLLFHLNFPRLWMARKLSTEAGCFFEICLSSRCLEKDGQEAGGNGFPWQRG